MPAKSLELRHPLRLISELDSDIGDFSRFDSPDKILTYTCTSPSGHLIDSHSHIRKRGSRYLRFALINTAEYVCHWDKTFGTYLLKKSSEGKHHNVTITHATKELVCLIYVMEKSGKPYRKAA